MDKIIINTDGGARGNPGPAAIGVVISDIAGNRCKTYSEYLGDNLTNNDAEYQAVIFALKKSKLLFGKEKVKKMEAEVRSDSEFLVKQMNGEYKINDEKIQKLFIQLWNLKIDFGKVVFTHVRRELNKEADKLVNQALDNQVGGSRLF